MADDFIHVKQMELIRKREWNLAHLAQSITQAGSVDPSAMGTPLVIGELTDREVRHAEDSAAASRAAEQERMDCVCD